MTSASVAIPGAGIGPDDGWVDPTSTSELWWPSDLPHAPEVRPCLNVLFRGGIVSYVSAGMDVRVRGHDGDEDGSGGVWRNYGMNSQPLARQWTTFDAAMDPSLTLEAFLLTNGDDDGGDGLGETSEPEKVALFAARPASIVNRIAEFTASVDVGSPLADGFHVVSFPLTAGDDADAEWVSLPELPPKVEVVEQVDAEGKPIPPPPQPSYRLVVLAAPAKLLLGAGAGADNNDDDGDDGEDMATMAAERTSLLEVKVSWASPGGASRYLTEPYKKLYLRS